MKDVPFVLREERQIYVEYDRERRLRLSRIIAPIFAVILTLLLIASQIVPEQFQGTRSNLSIIVLCDVLFVLGAVAAWRRMVNLATASILGAALLIMVLSVLANQPFILSDLFTVPAVVIIGLSALIGLPWMILATTAGTTAFVLVLAQSASLHADMGNHNNINSVGAFVIEQWVLAAIVYGAARGYRRILRQISDVRVQYERAKKLDELKDQFITSVNHELRNPVMLVQGNIELLRLKGKEMAPERRDAMIQRASDAGDKLVQLVQSILDTRRMDQGARDYQPEAVPVFESIASAAGFVDPSEGKGVERELRIQAPHDMTLWGEPIRLQQIITNLLSNALKYSAPGTPIEVSAKLVAEEPTGGNPWQAKLRGKTAERKMVEIAVRDHGFGIPPEQIPLLFQRFVRLPRDLASNIVGNGLGLYLCRELTEAMDGRIWVESSGLDGEGSTFFLRLPIPPATVHASERLAQTAKES
ncbi:MAG TPA: HAMP domain-containing sensor histidine kinase [Ktedonobacterales bacterium]